MFQELQMAQQFILSDELKELLVSGGVNLLAAALILIAGWVAASWLAGWVRRILARSDHFDTTLKPTTVSLVRYFTVGIDYGDDIDTAQKIVMDVLARDSRILADPAPMAPVGALGASSVDIVVRCRVCNSDYWDVLFDLQKTVKLALDAGGITIPFPQCVVTLRHESGTPSPPLKAPG